MKHFQKWFELMAGISGMMCAKTGELHVTEPRSRKIERGDPAAARIARRRGW